MYRVDRLLKSVKLHHCKTGVSGLRYILMGRHVSWCNTMGFTPGIVLAIWIIVYLESVKDFNGEGAVSLFAGPTTTLHPTKMADGGNRPFVFPCKKTIAGLVEWGLGEVRRLPGLMGSSRGVDNSEKPPQILSPWNLDGVWLCLRLVAHVLLHTQAGLLWAWTCTLVIARLVFSMLPHIAWLWPL